MKNREIADIFGQIADILELLGEQPFRVNSYRKAQRIIGDLAEDIAALAEAGKLRSLPGIGEATAAKIEEYLATGRMTRYEELKGKIPSGVVEMMRVSGLGPKTAGLLYKEAGIESIAQLSEAIAQGKLTDLPGMGAKKLENIQKGIQIYLAG